MAVMRMMIKLMVGQYECLAAWRSEKNLGAIYVASGILNCMSKFTLWERVPFRYGLTSTPVFCMVANL